MKNSKSDKAIDLSNIADSDKLIFKLKQIRLRKKKKEKEKMIEQNLNLYSRLTTAK